MAQSIKRGILMQFNAASYTASVLLLEATSTALDNVPIATQVDGCGALPGALCAVLFFDESNYSDAVVLAIYPNGAGGVPSPAPGRLTFISGFQHVNTQVINNNVTATYTLAGVGGIPVGALGVLCKAFFSSPTAGAFLHIAPHGATITNYITLGGIPVGGAIVYGGGLVALDAQGRIDIKANAGNCTVWLYTHGYIF
jgi:hypothetical protein